MTGIEGGRKSRCPPRSVVREHQVLERIVVPPPGDPDVATVGRQDAAMPEVLGQDDERCVRGRTGTG